MSTKLTRADTTALWHALEWMSHVLQEWRKEGFKDARGQEQYEVELKRLRDARMALRKVNKLRRGAL